LGVGAALSSVGLNAEAGGTAISRIMIDMSSAVQSGGEKLDAFAKLSNMSSAEFQKAFKEDAASAILAFVSGLNRTSEAGGNVFAVLEDLNLGEIRVRDASLRAAAASDLFKDALNKGTVAFKENVALTNVANQRFGTTASQFTTLKNNINDVFITLGNSFLPALNTLLTLLNKHPAAITAIVGTLGTLTIVLGGFVGVVKGIESTIGAFKALGDVTKLAKDSIDKYKTASDSLLKSQEAVKLSTEKVATALDTAGKKTKEYKQRK
jgi:TP901 family phage tail tape measure protein